MLTETIADIIVIATFVKYENNTCKLRNSQKKMYKKFAF